MHLCMISKRKMLMFVILSCMFWCCNIPDKKHFASSSANNSTLMCGVTEIGLWMQTPFRKMIVPKLCLDTGLIELSKWQLNEKSWIHEEDRVPWRRWTHKLLGLWKWQSIYAMECEKTPIWRLTWAEPRERHAAQEGAAECEEGDRQRGKPRGGKIGREESSIRSETKKRMLH